MPQGRPWEYEAIPLDEPTERPWETATVAPLPSSISAQPERDMGESIRNWLAGLASERRIGQQERAEIGDVGMEPTWTGLGKAGVAGLAAGLAPVGAISAPMATILSLLGGAGGGMLGGELGEAAGEKVAPGVGTLGREAGEFTGSQAGAMAPVGLGALLGRFPGLANILTRSGLRDYASLAKPKTKAEEAKLVEQLGYVKEELPVLNPVTPRGQLEKVAEAKLKPAGKAVKETYSEDITMPRGYKPVIERLEAERAQNVRVPEREVVRIDELTGEPSVAVEPAIPKSKPLAKAVGERLNVTQQAQRGHEEAAGKVTARDYLEARKTADEMARQAKATVFEKSARELQPTARALKAEREAMQQEMHRVVKDGKKVDSIFAAWKQMQKAGQQADAGTFLERWLIARVVGGVTGTVLGAGAAKTAFWRSLSGKTKLGMAKALERGNKETFVQLMAAAAREASQSAESTHTMPGGQKMTGATHTPASKPVEEEE